MTVDRFPQEQYTDPPGDPGLFGPDSVTWRVHSDLSMLVGGVSSLMLQALHPLAMAGMVDHSDYRSRPFARLSRTASFVTATTYASTDVALSVISAVRAVHEHVVGVAPDGRPYSASDPELLRWVHVAEVASFVRAHQRYYPSPVSPADIDRYYDEVAVVAERLGAAPVPRSRAEVQAYFREVRPSLVAGPDAHAALRWLLQPRGTDVMTTVLSPLLARAGLGLLPGWARSLYGATGWHPRALELGVVRPAVWSALATVRRSVGETPVLTQSRARALGSAVSAGD